METLKLSMHDADKAAELLRQGSVIAFPTETVYGLGVVYDNEAAFRELVAVKRRPADKPFTLMCGSAEEIAHIAVLDERTRRIIKAFMPGPITIIVKVKEDLPTWVSLGTGRVGLRVSDLPFVQAMIAKVGKPLLVPSANKSSELPASSGQEAMQIFNGEIAAVVFGPLSGQLPSTIINIGDTISLVRPGPIPFDKIVAVAEGKE